MSGAFKLIGEEEQPAPRGAATSSPTERATGLLMLSLRALSKRFVDALLNLFGLVTVASAWLLWHQMSDPNPLQLGSLGIYALFVLGMNIIARRRS